MTFDYFYKEQSEQYAFYRIPKVLIVDEEFADLSTDAKLLYGLLLDRVSLSSSSGWLDECGRVYIIYTIKSIQRDMCCGVKKAVKLLKELEGAGLIEKVIQDAQKDGYAYLEAYPNKEEADMYYSYVGPMGLYKKFGFEEYGETEQRLVLRKKL